MPEITGKIKRITIDRDKTTIEIVTDTLQDEVDFALLVNQEATITVESIATKIPKGLPF